VGPGDGWKLAGVKLTHYQAAFEVVLTTTRAQTAITPVSTISAAVHPRELQLRDRIIAGGLGIAAAAIAVLVLVVLTQRQSHLGYAMPVAVLVVATACVLLTLLGAALAMRYRQPLAAWLTLLTTLLFVAAVVTIFSFGLAFLAAGIISLVARVRIRAARPSQTWRSRVGAGLLLSLGFAPLSLLAIQGPIVACMTDGVSSSTPLWTWFGGLGAGGMSSGGSSDSNRVTGTVSAGGTTYSYICMGDRLVQFSP
jgi:hypothetical protein